MEVADKEEVRFPDGASIESIKKTARRRVREDGVSHTDALNALAAEHGVPLPWDEALWYLEHGGRRALSAVTFEGLESLGFTGPQRTFLRRFLMKTHRGLVLFAGEHGSGRTISSRAVAASVLRNVPNKAGLEVLPAERAEDDEGSALIQYPLPATTDWSAAVSALVRVQPEIMVVHEMEAPQLAALPFHVAMSGHLALVEAAAPYRGVEALADLLRRTIGPVASQTRERALPFNILLIEQALVPATCDACALPLEEAQMEGIAELRKHLTAMGVAQSDGVIANPAGCDICDEGFLERTALIGMYEADLQFFQAAVDLAAGKDVDVKAENLRLRRNHPETTMDANKVDKIAKGWIDARS